MKMICEVEGCEKTVKVKSRRLCAAHYGRWEKAQNALKDCAIEGCTKPAWQKAWCCFHYSRYRKHGDPLAGPEKQKSYQNREICNWSGCERLAKSRGFCPSHYAQARYSSKYEHLIPEESRAERCIIPECSEPQYIAGLCRKHDVQRRRGKDPFQGYERIAIVPIMRERA